mmetsp:Transcript_98121/g.286161  ORF Transcript_98121/g.286161 Transcript_98121/m.286161 type:complete len:389 (-) Transcript_98121:120-1286(-)
MPAVLKMTYQGDIRRRLLEGEDVTYEDVEQGITLSWPGLVCNAMFHDKDGQPHTLSASTFTLLLDCGSPVAANHDVLMLRLEILDAKPSQVTATGRLQSDVDQQEAKEQAGANASTPLLPDLPPEDAGDEIAGKDVPCRACKTPGCPYRITFHRTHCCLGCALGGKDRHGPRCERKPAIDVQTLPVMASQPSQAAAGPVHGGATQSEANKQADTLAAQTSVPGLPRMEAGGGKEIKDAAVRACETPGCSFRATFLPSHCCNGCAKGGKDSHGIKCERKPAIDIQPLPVAAAEDAIPSQIPAGLVQVEVGEEEAKEQGLASTVSFGPMGVQPAKISAPDLAPRTCKTPGCTFQSTWHPTHCCKACASHGKGSHGGSCERKTAVASGSLL